MKLMRETVAKILDREIARLDELSLTAGLKLNDAKLLDLLIRAANTFATPPDDKPAEESSPEKAPIETLLDGINEAET